MFRSSFLTEHVDMRVINTSPGVWEAAYIRKVLGLNNRGLRLIADYYNRKYQINTERCERSLMIGENNVDVIDHFVRYISTHWADKRALFLGGGYFF